MSLILVTGAPRGGTKYVSTLLREVGLNVGHEQVLPDGCVSGFYFGDYPHYPVRHPTALSECGFDKVLHLVRDPLRAVPSLARWLVSVHNVRNWYKEALNIQHDDGFVVAAMDVWLHTHTLIHKNLKVDATVRLEHLPSEWHTVCGVLGLPRGAFPYHVPIMQATAYPSTLSWPYLMELSPERARKMYHMATDFGYR